MRITIVHGYSAGPHDHWFPWLSDRLGRQGHVVEVLAMPDSTAPVRVAWEGTLAAHVEGVDDESVLVTHSLGTVTVLRWLLTLDRPWRLRGLVAVSGFQGAIGAVPELDDYLAETVEADDLTLLAGAIDHRVMILSDDDTIVPSRASLDLAEALGARTVVVPGGGHFLADEGHTELAEVLRVVEELVEDRPDVVLATAPEPEHPVGATDRGCGSIGV